LSGFLKYTFNASIYQGPSESINEKLDMNTYDVVNIKITKGDKVISLLPDSETGIKFFSITSDKYGTRKGNDPSTATLTYEIKSNGTNPQPISIVLDRAHVLIGKSILDAVGNFSTLTIKSKIESDVNVNIMVIRDV